MYQKRALVVGATGVAGNNVVEQLLSEDEWEVIGISRRPLVGKSSVQHLAINVLDAEVTIAEIAKVKPTHVFFCAWTLGANEDENCAKNGAMLSNVLDGAKAGGTLQHVGIVTGMKHYLGPFEDFAKNDPVTPFREDAPRLPGKNFYYTLEDILWDRAKTDGFHWNVHRSQMIIGYAVGNLMNMAVTLGTYASLCKETGMPFVFPGHPTTWSGLNDMTDARILARQMTWAAQEPNAWDEAFNVANGEVIRWRELWTEIADYFGLEVADYPGEHVMLEGIMADLDDTWDQMVKTHRLQPLSLRELDSSWFTDLDLGRPMECVNSLAKCRALGFGAYQESIKSFTDTFDRLRAERILP